jgi:hypothetical protein
MGMPRCCFALRTLVSIEVTKIYIESCISWSFDGCCALHRTRGKEGTFTFGMKLQAFSSSQAIDYTTI